MRKTILMATALVALTAPAFGQPYYATRNTTRAEVNIRTIDVNAPRARTGSRVCPPGTTPMGRSGCAGETITDREALSLYDVPVPRGCVQGKPRTITKTGTENGQPVKWVIKQHMECNRTAIDK